MAIQPIDLQALFSQLDKVGKTQSVIREGQQIHESLQQNQIQRKLEENVRSVNETQDMGEESIIINEERKDGAGAKGGNREKPEEEGEDKELNNDSYFFKDPALGKNIDITG